MFEVKEKNQRMRGYKKWLNRNEKNTFFASLQIPKFDT